MISKIPVKIAAVLITVVLLVLLFTQINLEDVVTTLKNINPGYLIAGFILYTFTYFFRAWRFYILLNAEVGIRDLFNIVCVHNAINSLLPARTGELSYIYLLKKINNKTTGDGIATLVVSRIFDFVALIFLFFIATILVKDIPVNIMAVLWIIAGFTFFLLIILILLLTTGKKFVLLTQKTAQKLHIENNRGVNFLIRKEFETVESLDKIQMKKSMPTLVASSLLIWLLSYFLVYIIMAGLNFQISLLFVVLGGTFIVLTSILPIQGIAGFGTTETVWTLVFVPLGLSINQAIISGFCFHIIMILYFSVLGIYGAIKIKAWKNLAGI
jgi:uncharacterized protein (TIRG00374 family)